MKRKPDAPKIADLPPVEQNAALRGMVHDALEAADKISDPTAKLNAIRVARELLAELAAEAAAAVEAEETARKNAAPPGVDQSLWDALRAGDPLALARVNRIGIQEAIPTLCALPTDEHIGVLEEIIAAATEARAALLPPVDPFANGARPLLRVVSSAIEGTK